MIARCVVVCLAATAFVATTALMPTGAPAAGRGGAANVPQPGTWNWPPYAEGGNMPQTTCRYVSVNPRPYGPRGQGRWVYVCR
jgi:hypothetical protein